MTRGQLQLDDWTADPDLVEPESGGAETQGYFGPILQAGIDFSAPRPVAVPCLSILASIQHDEDADCYVATIPSLPGCVGEGATQEDAERDIEDAIKQVLQAHADLGTTPEFVKPHEYVPPDSMVTIIIHLDDPQS